MENLPGGANPEKPSSFSLSLSLQRGGIRGKLYSGKLISIYDFVVWQSTMSVRYDRFYFVFNNNWKNCVSRPISRPLFPAYITSDIGVFPFFFSFSFVYRVIDPLPLSGVITFVKNKNIKRYFKRDIISTLNSL